MPIDNVLEDLLGSGDRIGCCDFCAAGLNALMKTALTIRATRLALILAVLSHFALSASVLSKVKVTRDPQKTRADYVARMQQQAVPPPAEMTLGSLWTSNGMHD